MEDVHLPYPHLVQPTSQERIDVYVEKILNETSIVAGALESGVDGLTSQLAAAQLSPDRRQVEGIREGLLSPIRTVPVDILHTIFIFVPASARTAPEQLRPTVHIQDRPCCGLGLDFMCANSGTYPLSRMGWIRHW